MLTGEKVRLRPPMLEDVERWMLWMNDPDVGATLCSRTIYGYTREAEVEFYNHLKDSRNAVFFSVDTLEGRHVGSVGLHRINWEWRNAEMGILIGAKDAWGKGYCTDAVRLITRFAFERMNLHRVYLYVCSTNIGGIKCYEKAGFVKEGILRENRYYDGKYYDDLVMGLIYDSGRKAD